MILYYTLKKSPFKSIFYAPLASNEDHVLNGPCTCVCVCGRVGVAVETNLCISHNLNSLVVN